MSADLLRHIPGIEIHEPAAGVLAVTAPDGFHLTINYDNGVWRFYRGAVSTATHFHLRRLINDALNPVHGSKA